MSKTIYWLSAGTTGTSSVFNSPEYETSKIYVLSDGDDAVLVAVQFKNPAGTYRSFPDTELTGKGAKEIIIPPNTQYRINVSGGTAANVEVKSG